MVRFFSKNTELYTAAAPGRMDVMGGIADYSGSLLLQMPVRQLTKVTIEKRKDKIFRIRSVQSGHEVKEFHFEYNIPSGITLQQAGKIIRQQECGDWAVYVMGCFILLEKEKGLKITGANILIESDLQVGKGVSSSAAIEVATIQAIAKAWRIRFTDMEIPVLAQRVENYIVGAACGLMDQLSVYFGQKNKLLPLVCQPHIVFETVTIPAGIQFTGIDSGVRHEVGGAEYGDVRTAAFMAYSVIAQREGVSKKDIKTAYLTGDWNELPFRGYLANIPVSEFEQNYARFLPEKINGKDFQQLYGGIIDHATSVDPVKIYDLLSCARHPVYEQQRVSVFLHLLKNYSNTTDKTESLKWMGEMMMQSHASYNSVGLGNSRTDELVQKIRDAGPEKGVYGARISGGGSGGTVVVLSRGQVGKNTVKSVYEFYKNKYRQNIFLFTGSNHGSLTLNR